VQVVVTLREHFDMDKGVAKHLMQNYGTRALLVAKIAEEMAQKNQTVRRALALRLLLADMTWLTSAFIRHVY
jgi:glycerol-3-phosphate dehydrogenase